MQLAHKRQKDYYDCRTGGKGFKQAKSVWLHTLVFEKGVAPKFHELLTGPFKVKKRLSNDILDLEHTKQESKVVLLDRLKRVTVNSVEPRVH